MIELKFTGFADVVRAEMLQLLGIQTLDKAGLARVAVEVTEMVERMQGETAAQKTEPEPTPEPTPEPAVVDDTAAAKAEASKKSATKAEAPKKSTTKEKESAPSPLESTAGSAPAPNAPSAAASAAPTPASGAAKPVPAEAAAPATEITWDEIRAAIETFGKAKGPKPLIEFVRSFDVQRASQIPKERYGEVLKRLAEVA